MKLVIKFLILVAILGMTLAEQCDPTFQFECKNGKCVSGSRICNGYDDCGDLSDERDASGVCPLCPIAMYPCKNWRCTFPNFLCDGLNDCWDWSDERNEFGKCPECPAAAFKCPKNNVCILPSHVCDGYNDCFDWSDESEKLCSNHTYTKGNREHPLRLEEKHHL